MALEEFEKEETSKREKGYLRMRSMMDYGMGLLWTSMGVFLLFKEHFNTSLQINLDETAAKIFGGLCLLYGLFRIYRGYKQNYYRDR